MRDLVVNDWDIREFNMEKEYPTNDEGADFEETYRNTNKRKNSVKNTMESTDGNTDDNNDKKDDEDSIKEYGQSVVDDGEATICLISIIGEVEGHECLPSNTKTTKYEHVLPKLAEIEDNKKIDGVLLLLNTVGGDVESGLAIAEMVASLSKPTVSLVLGGSHSIGVPLAVSTDYSMIVPSGTMVIHPVRMSGTVIGAPATYDYFKRMQDRIITFITTHCNADYEAIEKLMMNTQMLTKDIGTILVGKEAVEIGLIDEIGGISEAFKKLKELIKK
jgi:ATP-dependent protease ClpP protease subunit